MKTTINNIEYDIPFDCDLITLGQYIDYREAYGKELDKKLETILSIKDDVIKYDKLDDHLDNEAIAWFSFWTKLPLHDAKKQPSITPLLSAYRVLKNNLQINEEEIVLPKTYVWQDSEWQIQDFKINPASEMDFNEIITSKELMKQLYDMGEGKYESLLYLSGIFFRKVGERFKDEFLYDGSERLKMLKELPLTYAMDVYFFLKTCVNFWRRTFLSLDEEAA